ncbi:hypothetical protein [Pseudooctadecabacter jejudonensis]|uniref:Uncharacterized protein n=1 Tax=Pseudooctadecabacter jejudonensis TaxID=1391910 RepID=A0A1Y5RH09_9RHOB|nr:hypothetical protein [Pseudooctadecabacter jejudonensis]SLN14511.1 hypothetical protein PSJ8397_00275 [Pseudooctadecabacter jejudonensis]
MKWIFTVRRDCLPREVTEHLERQGLGWGHELDAGCFRSVEETRRG